MFLPQETSPQPLEASEAEEVITIEHSDDGTSVSISDPSGWEVVALVVVVAGLVLGLYIWRRFKTAS